MSKEPSSVVVVRGSFSRRFLNAAGDGLIADLLSISSLCFALGGAPRWIPLTLGALSLAVALAFVGTSAKEISTSVSPTGTFILARTVVLIMVTLQYPGDLDDQPWLWVATALLALLIVLELSVARVAKGAIPYAAHLPGISVKNRELFSAGYIFPLNSLALVAFAAMVMTGAPPYFLLLIPLICAFPSLVSVVDGVLRIAARRSAEQRINRVLRDYAPVFAVHWDAPAGDVYQVAMWLPYLERLQKKFVVIVRNQSTFNDVAALTDHPVMLRKEPIDLDALVVPSLKAAFYVNSATKNAHFVRLAHVTHIQLNHGDSDKGPSYSPVFRMFDKNFVAGQAAIDRFAAHGVEARPEMFAIVGRPQVEAIEVRDDQGSGSSGPVVLYAPTWAGFHADSNYSSLTIGYEIVSALLERGCPVIFRPHPYTSRTPRLASAAQRIKDLLDHDRQEHGRPHVFGLEAEVRMTLVDCFNAADALVADVSSVLPDFLYSEKPFAITAMALPKAETLRDMPIAQVGYVIDSNLTNLATALDQLLGSDPLAKRRHEMKAYYLGDFPPGSYAEAFLLEAGKYLEE